jgi:WD40 repeat protein
VSVGAVPYASMREMSRTVRLFALLAMTAVAGQAQGPSAGWQTVATAHFRVHYPAGYERWASRAASRLESIRAAVAKEVGFDPPQTIDVIVMNPVASANGMAWPLLDAPRILFFTEPPGPDEQIGAYSDWIDLLAVHEIAHIMHMLRPSRNPMERAMERFVVPLDPITLGAPRWVLEGYATVVEGRLTGAGRPPSTMRAVVLRKWASSGRLPSYAQLDSDTRFLGMSMAYLAGSAYLEWLEARTGEGSLRKLWARMTARQRRSFPAAFAGVFGDSPQRLYDRFRAELTSSAVTVNRAAPLREGDLWQETLRNSGDPAVSPDGSQIAIVIRERNKPSRIVVWRTGPDDEERNKFNERIARMMKRDPEDVAPVAGKPLPRKILHSFTPADGGDVATPRWTGEGLILFSHRQPDREGFLHHDLFLWNPATGESRRVTHLADVFDADPFPDGRLAVAVRSRFGLSQLVKVDLATGVIGEMTPPSLDTVYSHPRASGAHVAFVSHRKGEWTLSVDDQVVLSGVNVASPEWAGQSIIATVLWGGLAELHQIELTGEHHPITRSSGGAFEPAPSGDGRVFFMGLEPDGFVVRVTQSAPAEAGIPFDPSLVPAIPPVIPVPPAFASEPLSPPKPYGIGRQELAWLAAEQIATKQLATEVGVRIGDVLGRFDGLAIGSIGSENGQRGGAVASTWRGWPVAISAHLFTADDHVQRRNGMELRGAWTARWPLGSVSVAGGGLTGRPLDIAFLQVSGTRRQIFSQWRAEEELQLSAEKGSLAHDRGVLSASVKRGAFRVAGSYQHDESRDRRGLDVGGIESSILPRSAIPNRIFDPALPIGTLSGRTYDGARVEATIPMFPATAFYQHHRTDSGHLALAGLQMTFASESVPLLRLPALDLTAGVARILDEPLRNRTEFWFAMRWQP